MTDIVDYILSLPDTLKTSNSQEENFWWDSYNKEDYQHTYDKETYLNQQQTDLLTEKEESRRGMPKPIHNPKKAVWKPDNESSAQVITSEQNNETKNSPMQEELNGNTRFSPELKDASTQIPQNETDILIPQKNKVSITNEKATKSEPTIKISKKRNGTTKRLPKMKKPSYEKVMQKYFKMAKKLEILEKALLTILTHNTSTKSQMTT